MPDQTLLLVMVPGAGISPEDFAARGFLAELARRHPDARVTAVDPGLDSYLDGSVERRLIAAVEAARGGARVWLAGISLGCQGILRCLRLRPDLAEGAILLTPYLASSGLIAEVTRAGGLRRWHGNLSSPSMETGLLHWLATATLPPLLLGRARADRFRATSDLIAKLLPQERVIEVEGGHDWASWTALWTSALDRMPLAACA